MKNVWRKSGDRKPRSSSTALDQKQYTKGTHTLICDLQMEIK